MKDEFISIDDIIQGLVPWSYADLQEVNTFLFEVMAKPKDDWDLKPNDSPIPSSHPLGQVSKLMMKKYGEGALFKAHLIRYNNIIRFLHTHALELKDCGYLKPAKPYPMIKDELLIALCLLPYSHVFLDEDEGEQYVFSFREVIEKTQELME